MHPNITAPFRYNSKDPSKALLKKFRGSKEVYDIYTKENRISYRSSSLARYPSPSAPYDVSCIFIMMWGLCVAMSNRVNRLFLLQTFLLNWSGYVLDDLSN